MRTRDPPDVIHGLSAVGGEENIRSFRLSGGRELFQIVSQVDDRVIPDGLRSGAQPGPVEGRERRSSTGLPLVGGPADDQGQLPFVQLAKGAVLESIRRSIRPAVRNVRERGISGHRHGSR